MLNYKNDPLLLDKDTANTLIRKGLHSLIFLNQENHSLNLLSAFIKKEDFIKKDKISQPLQKTAYAKISLNAVKRIQDKFSEKQIIVIFEEYIQKRSNLNNSIQKWKRHKLFPLIVLRILSQTMEELSEFINETEYFTDFLNKSRFYPPKNLYELLNPQLVYLAGCSIGDGHIDEMGKRWTLVEGSSKQERLLLSRKFISNLASILKNYVDNYEIRGYETKYSLRTNNKLFCRFINFFFNHPFGKKKETILEKPMILDFSSTDLEQYFWKGCFDTDGSVNINGAVDFCSSDENLLSQCADYLGKKGVKTRKSHNLVTVNAPSLKNFTEIGFSHPRKQIEFLDRLKKGTKLLNLKIKDNVKIDKKLLEISPYIRLDQGSYGIRLHRKILNKFQQLHLEKIISTQLGCKLRETKDGRLYFKSKNAYSYLKQKFTIEPYWKPINKNEEIELLNRWNNIWD